MLLDHYGLREQPFGVTPNPRYLYLSPGHREALASLVYGVESGRGFVALVAPPGMGKTTLLFQLLERLGNSARTVFLFQTQCGSRDFLRSLMADLGVRAGEDDMVVLQAKLNEILIKEMRAGRKFVLVVDEAQNLEDSALESVRMLSNFETPRTKLMQIILAGQPQLAEKLARPAMVQLRQRISMFIRLRPLQAAETAEYIEHRLRVAGHGGPPLFSGGALSAIASESGGIPRNINNICFNALSLGYAVGRKTIDAATVQEVAADLDLSSFYAEAPVPLGDEAGTASDFPEDDRVRAEGWAVLLDRILSPSRDTGSSPGFGSERHAARPRSRGSSWKGAVEFAADRLRNRLMN